MNKRHRMQPACWCTHGGDHYTFAAVCFTVKCPLTLRKGCDSINKLTEDEKKKIHAWLEENGHTPSASLVKWEKWKRNQLSTGPRRVKEK